MFLWYSKKTGRHFRPQHGISLWNVSALTNLFERAHHYHAAHTQSRYFAQQFRPKLKFVRWSPSSYELLQSLRLDSTMVMYELPDEQVFGEESRPTGSSPVSQASTWFIQPAVYLTFNRLLRRNLDKSKRLERWREHAREGHDAGALPARPFSFVWMGSIGFGSQPLWTYTSFLMEFVSDVPTLFMRFQNMFY